MQHGPHPTHAHEWICHHTHGIAVTTTHHTHWVAVAAHTVASHHRVAITVRAHTRHAVSHRAHRIVRASHHFAHQSGRDNRACYWQNCAGYFSENFVPAAIISVAGISMGMGMFGSFGFGDSRLRSLPCASTKRSGRLLVS